MSRSSRPGPAWGTAELLGILLILAGAYWLLANSGIFGFLGWQYLWPIGLIAVGILLVVQRSRPAGGTSVVVRRDGAARLRLNLSMGGGRLRLAGGAAELVEARSTLPDLRGSSRREGDTGLVRLRQDRPGYGWFRGPTGWDVRVPDNLPVELEATAGAGDFWIDLSTVRLVRAKLAVGAARTRLVLGRPSGEVPVAISSGAAEVNVELPAGVEARITASGGLIDMAGTGETPGWATAADRVTVTVSGGVSTVHVLRV